MGHEKIAVIGLGYVGLPLAIALAKKFSDVVGFDVNEPKLTALKQGIDHTGEIDSKDLKASTLKYTSSLDQLKDRTFYIVAVPTPVDTQKRPDLLPLVRASETVGKTLSKGAVVVFESTVYPGVTQDVCGPELEKHSGLRCGVDFNLGYSPERINPGDKLHTLEKITKVVSGDTPATLERVADLYGAVVTAGVYRAASIKVAEAAKVIENTQRDLNIALMNELALIFDRLNIRTKDVLDAAGTKWNFLKFQPGLVGGHCIGVDPYYLTAKAEEIGYHPQVILAGRHINDSMGGFIATKTVKLLSQQGCSITGAKIGVLGLTFKEDVPDLRNSRVPDILAELREFGAEIVLHDPIANAHEAKEEYGVTLEPIEKLKDLDALIVAVAHGSFRTQLPSTISKILKPKGVLVDVKSILNATDFSGYHYWSL